MIIGILTIELDIAWAGSLKDKRKVLLSLKDRVRHKFNVSIAEIEAQDVWNIACLGVIVVANQQTFANQVLSQVVNAVEAMRDCELADYTTEFIQV